MKNAPPDKMRLSVDNKKTPSAGEGVGAYMTTLLFRLVFFRSGYPSGIITIRRMVSITAIAI